MKAQELRNITVAEMQKQLNDAHQELFNLRFQSTTGQLKNFKRIAEVKQNIARIETILREHEL
ncbi:MAG: 50S ribosomal protein L29, partial [Chloroflexi bacterium]|nr:50S ribosomal protein L29 [Chloroflexota bacterium]